MASRRRTLKQLPNARQTTNLTPYLSHNSHGDTCSSLRGPHFEQEPEIRTAPACAKPTSTEQAQWEDRAARPFLTQTLLLPGMSQLSVVIKSPALFAGCTSALSGGMLPLLFQLSIKSKPQSPSLGFLRPGFNCIKTFPSVWASCRFQEQVPSA